MGMPVNARMGTYMKFAKIELLLVATMLFVTVNISFVSLVNAQGPVNGNGEIMEQIRPLTNFTSISLDFPATLLIVNGETPSFRIITDENVLPYIGTRVRSGKLFISQDRWIEPSQRVEIRIGVPFVSELITSGYSDAIIEAARGPRLRLDIGVGSVSVLGAVNRLQVRTKTGTIDAAGLEASYADIAISSSGVVKLGAVSELIVDIYEKGVVVYEGEPEIRNVGRTDIKENLISASDYVEPDESEVTYVSLTLVNNSRKRAVLRVEGPRERSFGYGFNLRGMGKRGENWPVGTRLYSENGLLGNKLLLTVTEEMQGQLVDIFQHEGK